ncbi:2-succinyl-6-hydroxy-2,4-cyclohexadiene-1-carboxylate synthase [BD1-7 clade bacterium]|uniref:2-succinyl-6-hydroxy-2,4-cyclohexadiene-1-carboxy late synthase n=1 Tax=BD1-7 clade bacterium TaxID=2029982 RepID=A0A5S9NPI4_9GAMM|nr:2-succinyl-6-hydroxy-2,4-cyclohexadiene-1-carboxylate synthase [BD1-7 clade bacterium]
MNTYVLVHGAWHGAWCWRDVKHYLAASGAVVYTPCMPAVGERVNEDASTVTFSDYVDDLVYYLNDNVPEESFTLVGHSLGGGVAAAAADHVINRLKEVVILDGLMLESGECCFDYLPEALVAQRIADAQQFGGDRMPPPSLDVLGIETPEQRQWATQHLTPHPLKTYQTSAPERIYPLSELPVRYVNHTFPKYPYTHVFNQKAEALGWSIEAISAPHEAVITHPREVASCLMR